MTLTSLFLFLLFVLFLLLPSTRAENPFCPGVSQPSYYQNGVCNFCTDCATYPFASYTPRYYEVSPCTNTEDAVCASCTSQNSCPSGTTLYDCGGTPGTCEPCYACDPAAGEWEWVPCSTQEETRCHTCPDPPTPCWTNEYVSQNCSAYDETFQQCATCAVCQYRQTYETKACGPYTDRECSACSTSCPAAHYIAELCVPSADLDCQPCSTGACGAEQYELPCYAGNAAGNSRGRDRTCEDCRQCGDGEYVVQECGGSSNRFCAACSDCLSGQYIVQNCSRTGANTQCASCGFCPSGEYISRECTSHALRECRNCSACEPGVTYQSRECGYLRDTECLPCASGCKPGEERLVGCDVQHGPFCSACRACGEFEYQRFNCTELVDTTCDACQNCTSPDHLWHDPARQLFYLRNCTQFEDSFCWYCDQCVQYNDGLAGEYTVSACTDYQDTVCAPCKTCGERGLMVDTDGPRCSDANGALSCRNCTVCEAWEYRFRDCVPPWDDTNCVACYAECPFPNTFAYAPCNETHQMDCSECTQSCGAGEWVSAPCTPEHDLQCTPCSASVCEYGFFMTQACEGDHDILCLPCSNCSASEYEVEPCTETSDTECAACSECGGGYWRGRACNATHDTECHRCTTCDIFNDEGQLGDCPEYYVSYCQPEQDTVCGRCDACDPSNGTYYVDECRVSEPSQCGACGDPVADCWQRAEWAKDGFPNFGWISHNCSRTFMMVCHQCHSCLGGEYMLSPCGRYSRTECAACRAPCCDGEFEAAPCGNTIEGGDRECRNCSRSCPVDSFRVANCSASADVVCSPCTLACQARAPNLYSRVPCTEFGGDRVCDFCTECTASEYVVSACNETHDTVCGSCDFCAAPDERYYVQDCGGGHDAVCADCTACDVGAFGGKIGKQFEAQRCGIFTDRQCQNCTVCEDWEYGVQACAPPTNRSQDRRCANCTVCRDDQWMEADCGAESDRLCLDCDPCGGGFATRECNATSNSECQACSAPCDLFVSGGTQWAEAFCGGTTDYVCRECTACGAEQWMAAECEVQADRECVDCTECGAGEFEYSNCTATADRVCFSCTSGCSSGHWVSQNCSDGNNLACERCTSCEAGEFTVAACSTYADAECRNCTAECGDGEFISKACTHLPYLRGDTECSACDVCGNGTFTFQACDRARLPERDVHGGGPDWTGNTCPMFHYAASACNETHDTVCASCGFCTPHGEFGMDGTFYTRNCTATAPAECGQCTRCGDGEYVVSPCTAFHDTVCAACTTCGPETYAARNCTARSLDEDTLCAACDVCGAGWYAYGNCTPWTDRDCRTCRTCGAAGYLTKPCTEFADAECATCDPPFCRFDEWERVTCGGTTNRECVPCRETCGFNEFESRACAREHDRECSACSWPPVCPPGLWRNQSCSPLINQDSHCKPCREACAADEYQRFYYEQGEVAYPQCTDARDIQCFKCRTECTPGRYLARNCSATEDMYCAACTECSTVVFPEVEVEPCTNVSDRVCRPCLHCPQQTFESVPCDAPLADTVCDACMPCGAETYREATCTGSTTSDDSGCSVCSVCDALTQEEVHVCTGLTDTMCRPRLGCEERGLARHAAREGLMCHGDDFYCALLGDGGVRCWGDNSRGQRGTAVAGGEAELPLSALEVHCGRQHVCALAHNHSARRVDLWCWGSNVRYQTGTASVYQGSVDVPTRVDFGGVSVLSVSLGYYYTCVILDNAERAVKCWGQNWHGQLGWQFGLAASEIRLANDAAALVFTEGHAVQVNAGHYRTCVLLDSNVIKCWGTFWHEDDRTGERCVGGCGDMASALVVDLGTNRTVWYMVGEGDALCAVFEGGGAKCFGRDSTVLFHTSGGYVGEFGKFESELGANLEYLFLDEYLEFDFLVVTPTTICTVVGGALHGCGGDTGFDSRLSAVERHRYRNVIAASAFEGSDSLCVVQSSAHGDAAAGSVLCFGRADSAVVGTVHVMLFGGSCLNVAGAQPATQWYEEVGGATGTTTTQAYHGNGTTPAPHGGTTSSGPGSGLTTVGGAMTTQSEAYSTASSMIDFTSDGSFSSSVGSVAETNATRASSSSSLGTDSGAVTQVTGSGAATQVTDSDAVTQVTGSGAATQVTDSDAATQGATTPAPQTTDSDAETQGATTSVPQVTDSDGQAVTQGATTSVPQVTDSDGQAVTQTVTPEIRVTDSNGQVVTRTTAASSQIPQTTPEQHVTDSNGSPVTQTTITRTTTMATSESSLAVTHTTLAGTTSFGPSRTDTATTSPFHTPRSTSSRSTFVTATDATTTATAYSTSTLPVSSNALFVHFNVTMEQLQEFNVTLDRFRYDLLNATMNVIGNANPSLYTLQGRVAGDDAWVDIPSRWSFFRRLLQTSSPLIYETRIVVAIPPNTLKPPATIASDIQLFMTGQPGYEGLDIPVAVLSAGVDVSGASTPAPTTTTPVVDPGVPPVTTPPPARDGTPGWLVGLSAFFGLGLVFACCSCCSSSEESEDSRGDYRQTPRGMPFPPRYRTPTVHERRKHASTWQQRKQQKIDTERRDATLKWVASDAKPLAYATSRKANALSIEERLAGKLEPARARAMF